MKFYFPFLIVATLLGAVPAWCQSSLSLDEAVSEGLNHSPLIQKSRATVEEYQWKKTEALGAGFLPKVSVSGTHYLNENYTITGINFGGDVLSFPGFYPTTSFSLNVSVPLFDGLSNINQLKGANLMEEATEKELSRAEFQLQKDIELAFYQALAAAQLDAVAEENVKTMEDHLKQIQIRNRGGVATKYDALRVEVQLNEAHADAIDAEDNEALTRRNLSKVLGLESDDRPLTGTLPVPEAAKVRKLEYTNALQARDDITALNLKSEAAGKFHAAQQSWLVPNISVGGQYLLYNQQFFSGSVIDTGNYQNAYNVGLFLSWNLFDGGVALARTNEAAYQEIEAEKTVEAAKVNIPYDFEYWKRRYVSNSDHYLSKQLDVTRSEESVRLAKEEERAGTRTSTETLDAELDLYRSRAGVVNAQVSAAEAQIHLELVIGRSL